MEKEIQDRKAAEALAKLEAENQVKEQQKQTAIAYRTKVKELVELCKEKLSGTKYDKFWVESILKRYATIQKLNPIVDYLKDCTSKDAFIEFIT